MFSLRHASLAVVAALGLSFGATGCAPEHPDVVPSTAQMNLSGNGMEHFVAPADGMVYVFDQPAQRLIWSGHVIKGQAVDIDTDKSAVSVAGILVVNKLASPADRKDIYFDPSPLPAPQPAAYNTGSPSNGVTVTPNVTVQPGQPNTGSVTVQPGVQVTPTPSQPTNP